MNEPRWQKGSILIGSCVALCLAITVATVSSVRMPFTATFKDFLSAVVSVAGVMAGFATAAKSVLLTMPETKGVTRFRAAGGLVHIVKSMSLVASASIMLASTGCVMILLSQWLDRHWYLYAVAIWMGIGTTTVIAHARFAYIFSLYAEKAAGEVAKSLTDEQALERAQRRAKAESEGGGSITD